jgi:hypothetical protein
MASERPPRAPSKNAARLLLSAGGAFACATACRTPPDGAAPLSDGRGSRPAAAPSGALAAVAIAPAPAKEVRELPPARREAATEGPRVFAKTRFVWIREHASWASQWIGYLWPGSSVKLRSPKPIYARGCETWYAVEPRGYVCVDGRRATLDPGDPEFAELVKVPITSLPTSHRYAQSIGAPRYTRLPDRAEQRAREPDLLSHLALVDAARRTSTVDPSLAGIDLTPAPRDAVAFARLPVDLQAPRPSLRRDSTVAFLDEYRYQDRSFLLTPDLAWVPKDRVRPYESVTFEGAHLDGNVKLPIAFFRERPRGAFERGADGHLVPSARKFARLAWVELTGATEVEGTSRFLETREAGLWALESDSVVPEPAAEPPWSALRADDNGASTDRKTWLEASVYGGWLIAYENMRPVFATLMAPGRGGGKSPDAKNLVSTSSTPLGVFPVTGKFVTATMDGPEGVVHSDVPWVQNFRSAHAIHSAYWHDAWGERVSGGCLNVSPGDGHFLFGFTEPKLPDGWHGVRWDPHLGPATVVVVHR